MVGKRVFPWGKVIFKGIAPKSVTKEEDSTLEVWWR